MYFVSMFFFLPFYTLTFALAWWLTRATVRPPVPMLLPVAFVAGWTLTPAYSFLVGVAPDRLARGAPWLISAALATVALLAVGRRRPAP
jgi:hypothetical protein